MGLGGGLQPLVARLLDGHDLAKAARTAAEHDDPVGQPQRLVQIVGDVEGGRPLALPKRQEILHQQLARLGVERRQRLVQQQHGRAHGQCAGDADALAHAAGQLLGQRLAEVPQTHAAQAGLDALPPLGRRQRVVFEDERQVVLDAAPGQQGEVLEDEGDRVQAAVRHRARHCDGAGAGRHDAAGDAEQGGLAAARRADDGQNLPLLHRQVDAVQHDEVVVAVAQVLDDKPHCPFPVADPAQAISSSSREVRPASGSAWFTTALAAPPVASGRRFSHMA